MPPFVTRLSCISLFSTEPKSDNFVQKIYFSFTPLSKILVACLVAFTAVDSFFGRSWAADEAS